MDIQHAVWRTSTYSTGGGNNCVEVADLAVGVGVRDSKAPDLGALMLPPSTWRLLISRMKTGEFDLK